MTQPDPYHAIADPNRRTIIDLLQSRGPLRAGDIVAYLPHISQPAVSKHLRVLRAARLVYDIPEGRERWYHVNPQPLREIVQWLQHHETLWDRRLATLKELVEQGTHPGREDTPALDQPDPDGSPDGAPAT